MKAVFFALIATLSVVGAASMRPPSLAAAARPRFQASSYVPSDPNIPAPTTGVFSQLVDHFNFENPGTFNQTYLYYSGSYEAGGPIFFYTGNEGQIEGFWNNTGFMFTLAREQKALVVFVEHRYYGSSLPFGADSYQKQNVGLLGSEQALADYARFWTYALQLNNSKAMFGLELDASTPVIAFGGSYGGMLSAWMRMRYPNIIYGALAASAPILQFEGLTDPGVFNEIVTADFAAQGNCSNQLKDGLARIVTLGQTPAGRTEVSKTLGLCAAVEDGQQDKLYDYIYSAITYMAMVDYPYPTNFLIPLPAWPVKAACAAAAPLTDPIAAVGAVLNVYYNTTGSLKCFNFLGSASPTLDSGGWDYQACTEMVMPMSSGGPNDLFPPYAWNLTDYIIKCQDSKKWGVTPRPYWTQTYYGGKKILPATNIIFSNGKLDPWHGGGVLEDQSSTVVAIVIDQSAHHLDLRSPNPADPPSVVTARQREAKIIAGWVKEARGPGPYNTDWMFATTALMFFAAICATAFLICNGRSDKKSHKLDEPLLE